MRMLELLAIIILWTMVSCTSEDELPTPKDNTLAKQIESLIQPLVNDGTTVGASVGIVKPGGKREMFFFGEKTKDNGDTPDAASVFEIGSITKTMTATILANMALEGELNIDSAIELYLNGVVDIPEFEGEKITFKHLANHTSGLPRIPDNFITDDFDENHPYLNYRKDDMYGFLENYQLAYPIGSKEDYSNVGSGLLGHVLGEIKNTSFETQLHEVVFDKLGMTNTYTKLPNSVVNLCQPYDEDLKAWPMWEMSDVMLGAGGVKSCLDDMLTYLEANMGYGNSELIQALQLTHVNTQTLNDPFTIGLSWNKAYKAENNTTLTWHDGATRGTVSFIGFIEELDVGVFIVFNTEIIERTGDPYSVISKGVEILSLISGS